MAGVECLDFRGFGSQFLLTYTQLALKLFIPKTSNDQNVGVNLLCYDNMTLFTYNFILNCHIIIYFLRIYTMVTRFPSNLSGRRDSFWLPSCCSYSDVNFHFCFINMRIPQNTFNSRGLYFRINLQVLANNFYGKD